MLRFTDNCDETSGRTSMSPTMCRILLLLSLAVLAVATDVSHYNTTSQSHPDKVIVINNYYSMNVNNVPLNPEYPKSGNCSTNNDCSWDTACLDNYCVDPCSMCAINANCLIKDHTAACSCSDGLAGDPFTECTPGNNTNIASCSHDIPGNDKFLEDPCSLCGINTDCLAKNHTGVCSCKDGHSGNAFTECTPVDCSIDDDCAQDSVCVNNLCVDSCLNAMCGTNTDCHVKNHTAACSCTEGHVGNPLIGCTAVIPVDCPVNCTFDDDCAQNRACVNSLCVDPCFNTTCGINTDCHVKDHTAACSCTAGHVGNPLIDCKLVDCVANDDCPQENNCVRNECVDPCSSGVCGPDTHCTVKDHTAACSCKAGYSGDPFSGCVKGRIPDNYNATDGKYYLYYHQANWFEALDLCASHGLRLATFDNAYNYEQLVYSIKYSGASKFHYWIGASSLGDFQFKWASTNSPLAYTPWSQGEPNSLASERCVELSPDKRFQMNNIPCTTIKNMYVACEHM